ncbi:MAG TPA: HPF/RaiA family ribosome-associated protein [Gemmatimonadales bacterium]|nr:HPF/RaiA family ribosome-associated protein [Gemmatimonadales bacterium]
MRTTISARHCEISDELRQRAETVLTRLTGLVNRPVDGTIVFDVAKQLSTVEIRIHSSSGELFVATGEEKDHRSALDRAEEKVKKQLDKHGDTRRSRGARDAAL